MRGPLWTVLPAGALALALAGTAHAAPAIDVISALEPAPGAEAGQVFVRATDSGGVVNAVRIDRADGSGSFFESACRVGPSASAARVPLPPAPFRRGAAVEFTLPVPPGGDGALRVTATSEPCSGTGASESTSRDVLLAAIAPGSADKPPAVDPLPVPQPIAGAAAGCANADLIPVGRTRKRVRRAVVCLVNAERAEHGLPKLRTSRKLERAAARHTADMRRRAYLAHSAPDGPDLAGRLRKARYWPATGGENIAAGTGPLSTARATIEAWMESEGHRANVLDRRFKEIGVALEPLLPSPPTTPGAVFTANFGRRG